MDTNGSADKSTAEDTYQRSTQGEGPSGPKKRRRGSRGGKNRTKSADGSASAETAPKGPGARPAGQIADPNRKPQIGDTRPSAAPAPAASSNGESSGNKKRRRGGRGNLVPVADQFCADQKLMLKSSNAVKVVSAMVVLLADTKCVYKFVTESPR